MAFDIYGHPLRSGHCEVHPHVDEAYPCSVCLTHSGHPIAVSYRDRIIEQARVWEEAARAAEANPDDGYLTYAEAAITLRGLIP